MTYLQRGDRRAEWIARLDAAAEAFADPPGRGVRGRSWWPWVLFVAVLYVAGAELAWWWSHPEASGMEVLQALPEWVFPWIGS